MNVSQMLALPSFKGAHVIAGSSGLSREVDTAMIIEAPDIEKWGRSGQLLITSFYAFADLSDDELADFFAKADEIGVSAIAFKPERLVDSAPAHMVQLCEQHGIPLIQIPADTKYEGLLLDVLGHFLDSNLSLLNHFFDLHRRMMAFALKMPTILEIIMYLRKTIHADITFFDSTKDRRTTTNQMLSEFTSPRLHEIAPDRYRTHRYFDAQLSYVNTQRHATAVLIPSSDDQIYYLIIHTDSGNLAPMDIMAVENVVSLLQMEMLKRHAVDQKLFFQNNNLVHDLLLGRHAEHSYIDTSLETLGIAQHPYYQILLLRITLKNPAEIDRREDVLLSIRRRLKMFYPEIAYFESNDRIAFIHNFKGDSSRFDTAIIQASIKEVSEIPAMPAFSYLAALSGTGDRYGLPDLNKGVVDIAQFFDTPSYRNTCIHYDDLGVYKILMQVGDTSELIRYIDPRVARLHAEHPEFMDSVVTLCENNLNYQETARELYVHPKTIRYRADRMQKLYGFDLHNADDRMQIVLGDRIYKLADSQYRR